MICMCLSLLRKTPIGMRAAKFSGERSQKELWTEASVPLARKRTGTVARELESRARSDLEGCPVCFQGADLDPRLAELEGWLTFRWVRLWFAVTFSLRLKPCLVILSLYGTVHGD